MFLSQKEWLAFKLSLDSNEIVTKVKNIKNSQKRVNSKGAQFVMERTLALLFHCVVSRSVITINCSLFESLKCAYVILLLFSPIFFTHGVRQFIMILIILSVLSKCLSSVKMKWWNLSNELEWKFHSSEVWLSALTNCWWKRHWIIIVISKMRI